MGLKKYPSFTFLEALLALMITGTLLFFCQGVLVQLKGFQSYFFNTHQEDFHVFLAQLEYETKGFQLIEANERQLVFQDQEGKAAIFQQYTNMLRKSHNGGHHPLLLEVKTWQLHPEEKGSLVEVEFLNHEKYQGFFRYPPKEEDSSSQHFLDDASDFLFY